MNLLIPSPARGASPTSPASRSSKSTGPQATTIFVLATDPGLELTINGGSGDDTVNLGGEHAPILFDPPPFTYQPPAFEVQDPGIIEYWRNAWDPGKITLTRELDWHGGAWHSYRNNSLQFARDVVAGWILGWLFGFEIRPFQDVLTGDPNDPAVQGMTDDARANRGWFGLGGIFDLIARTSDTVRIEKTTPWHWWFEEGVSISFDMPAFTYRIGNEVLPPPRLVQPAEITVDPPAFAYKRQLSLRDGDFVQVGETIFKFLSGSNVEAKYHQEMYSLTTLDGLTKAYNRRYFAEALEREVMRSPRYDRPLCLALFDIDHFKKINDEYGHLAGDQVLRDMSRIILDAIRKEDIFSRYGGEEFALLLPEIGLEGASILCERLRELVEGAVFQYKDRRIPVTISCGIACTPEKPVAISGEQMIERHDTKLYEAKQSGRNQVCS